MMKYLLLCISLAILPSLATATLKVAITVDDLPEHGDLPSITSRVELTQKMLAAFKHHSVPGVYGFINGAKAVRNPKLDPVLKLWVEADYPLGNHTYSHQDLNEVTADVFKAEIMENEAALKKFSASDNWRLFRYPYLHEGNTLEKRNSIREFLKSQNYQIAPVSIDFDDWAWNNPYAKCVKKGDLAAQKWLRQTYLQNAVDELVRADKIARFLFKRSINHILLLHIGAFDAENIDHLLELYEQQGVQFITLQEALNDEVYHLNPNIAFNNGGVLLTQILKSRGLTRKDAGVEASIGYPTKEMLSKCQ